MKRKFPLFLGLITAFLLSGCGNIIITPTPFPSGDAYLKYYWSEKLPLKKFGILTLPLQIQCLTTYTLKQGPANFLWIT